MKMKEDYCLHVTIVFPFMPCALVPLQLVSLVLFEAVSLVVALMLAKRAR